jgi:hypothetical protein
MVFCKAGNYVYIVWYSEASRAGRKVWVELITKLTMMGVKFTDKYPPSSQ